MILHQSKFCVKCRKPKSFGMNFHLIKYYQNINLQYQLCDRNNDKYDFRYQFKLFILY